MEEATIRFFCQCDPPGYRASNYITDASYDYLVALRQVGVVRAIPIRGAELGHVDSRWHDIAQLFVTPMCEEYVNVVCGHSTDFVRYYTVGVSNIAIVPSSKTPSDKELAALRLYDEVICPVDQGARTLRTLGVKAVHMAAEPDQLGRLLSAYSQS